MGNIINFTSTGPNHLASLILAIRAEMVAEGWTIFDLNTDSTYIVSATSYALGMEFVARPPGNALYAGGGFVGVVASARDGGVNTSLQMYVGTGYRQLPAITTITKNAGVFTLEYSGAHGLAAGDLVFWNGNNDPQLNQSLEVSGADFRRVQGVGLTPTECTIASSLTGDIGPDSGGNSIQVFNFQGSRWVNIIGPFWQGLITLNNSIFTARIKVDKFRVGVVAEQAGIQRPIYAGMPTRGHVGARTKTTALLTAQVISDGVTPQVVGVDRNLDNLGVGSLVTCIPTGSLGPTAVIDNASCDYPHAQVTDKPTATSIEVVLPAGTYPAGSVIGEDPVPMMIGGDPIETENLAGALYWGATHRPNGVRPGNVLNALGYTLGVKGEMAGQDREAGDPMINGQTLGRDFVVYETSPLTLSNFRETMRPFVACAPGNNNYTILESVGGTPVDDDWLCYQSLAVGGVLWDTAFGPGAS